jgi:hypothetical protein
MKVFSSNRLGLKLICEFKPNRLLFNHCVSIAYLVLLISFIG